MRVQLRIVSGSLRGRKLNVNLSAEMRPTPQMVREALFSILGNAVPERPFYDVFAGTGANGFEAISRGASFAYFIERDFRCAQDIERHLEAFGVGRSAQVVRTDAYRWAAQWHAPREPVNLFISPPFGDFKNRLEDLMALAAALQRKAADESVIVIQTEKLSGQEHWAQFGDWEERRYGRNLLWLWVKEPPTEETESLAPSDHD